MKTSEIPIFQPRLKVVNREQAWAIHTAALEILEKTGFKMEHPGALAMLADAGAKVTNGDWIRLPAKASSSATTFAKSCAEAFGS